MVNDKAPLPGPFEIPPENSVIPVTPFRVKVVVLVVEVILPKTLPEPANDFMLTFLPEEALATRLRIPSLWMVTLGEVAAEVPKLPVLAAINSTLLPMTRSALLKLIGFEIRIVP